MNRKSAEGYVYDALMFLGHDPSDVGAEDELVISLGIGEEDLEILMTYVGERIFKEIPKEEYQDALDVEDLVDVVVAYKIGAPTDVV